MLKRTISPLTTRNSLKEENPLALFYGLIGRYPRRKWFVIQIHTNVLSKIAGFVYQIVRKAGECRIDL